MNSIFTKPYSYRQTALKNDLENYLTEIFAGVMDKDIPFRNLILDKINVLPGEEDKVAINTQSTHPLGKKMLRPDIEIKIANHTFILFENKVDSIEREGQLNDYIEVLRKQEGFPNKHLIYLTKYREIKDKKPEDIKFTQLIWSDIYDMAGKGGELAQELKYFIADKKLNMSGSINHLDALVMANLGDVFQKLDSIINTVRAYHQDDNSMGVRLDGGRSSSSIRDYGYYITGSWEEKEIQLGFFYSREGDTQVDVIYRIQGATNPLELKRELNSISKSEEKNWFIKSSDHNEEVKQVNKSKRLSEFMAGKADEVDAIIRFFREAIDELAEYKRRHQIDH